MKTKLILDCMIEARGDLADSLKSRIRCWNLEISSSFYTVSNALVHSILERYHWLIPTGPNSQICSANLG